MFCAFWALDIAPTWDVPVLLLLLVISNTDDKIIFNEKKYRRNTIQDQRYYNLEIEGSWGKLREEKIRQILVLNYIT